MRRCCEGGNRLAWQINSESTAYLPVPFARPGREEGKTAGWYEPAVQLDPYGVLGQSDLLVQNSDLSESSPLSDGVAPKVTVNQSGRVPSLA
jgi:hypothetical protein